jgi:hypothetical protein
MLSFVKVDHISRKFKWGGGEQREKGGLGSILFTCQEGKHNKNDRKIIPRSRLY